MSRPKIKRKHYSTSQNQGIQVPFSHAQHYIFFTAKLLLIIKQSTEKPFYPGMLACSGAVRVYVRTAIKGGCRV